MPYDPDSHHRRSIRLRGYDYSQPGAYFVTICTQGRECLFGQIVGQEMVPNEAGRMIDTWWHGLPQKFPHCNADAFVVMPNHIHGIIVIRDDIVGGDPCVGPDQRVRAQGAHGGARLPRIVQWFKTMTTNAYIRGVNERAWKGLAGRLWQRNYYEHIIRDEAAYLKIAEYIQTDPQRWQEDTYHV